MLQWARDAKGDPVPPTDYPYQAKYVAFTGDTTRDEKRLRKYAKHHPAAPIVEIKNDLPSDFFFLARGVLTQAKLRRHVYMHSMQAFSLETHEMNILVKTYDTAGNAQLLGFVRIRLKTTIQEYQDADVKSNPDPSDL